MERLRNRSKQLKTLKPLFQGLSIDHMKFKKYLSHPAIFYLVAFLLPFTILFFVYLSHGIYWGSETSPLLGDGFHQYVIFDVTLRNILHGTDSLLYTFTSGLGLNFYALSSYYLGSFLSPFVFFFDSLSMVDSVYLFTLIKIGLIGLSTYHSIKGIYPQLEKLLILSLSTSFALMSFSISQIEIKTWLDVFILAPLILLGLHRLMTQKKRVLYFTSLTILFIQNYYFGFMMAIFLTLWYCTQLSWHFKKRISSFLDFTVVSILSGFTSLIMIYPTVLDLRTHGENFTKITRTFTENSWYFDVFAKNFIGSFDTTKYGAIPMIYVGLFPFLLAILFFFVKSIRIPVKLAYLSLLTFLVASFYLQALDLFWQGMHAPNMFLHRYAWIFSLIILLMAAEVLNRLKEINWMRLSLGLILASSGFILTFLFRKHYEFLTTSHYILTLEFFIVFFFVALAFTIRKISLSIFSGLILFFTLFELSINSYFQMDGIATEWVFAARSSYQRNIPAIEKLTAGLQDNQEFYRTEILRPQTGNDTMKYNLHGISQFSSVRNTDTSSTLDKLGFKSDGTNLNLRYQNNTLLMDSLFAVKYNLAEKNPQKYGFYVIKSDETLSLYQNNHVLSLAFLTKEPYKDLRFSNLTLDNQRDFLNRITGKNLKYYQRIYPQTASSQDNPQGPQKAHIEADSLLSYASVEYQVSIPKDAQLYVNLPSLEFDNEDHEEVEIIVNDHVNRYSTDNVFPFFTVGNFKSGETVTIRIAFPENSTVTFQAPEFFALDLQSYQEAFDSIKKQKVKVQNKGNTVIADYQAEQAASLFFTLPYDKGWTATMNHQSIPIRRAQKGFMTVDVPKGKGQVVLRFIPHGLKEGMIAFLLGILSFACYNTFRNKFQSSKK